MRRLASWRLNANHLASLSKAIRRLREAGAVFEGLRPVRLALVGDGSHELIVDAMVASAARHGLLLDVVDTPFNSAEAELLNVASTLHRSKPDAVLMNFTYRAFRHIAEGALDDVGAANEIVEESLARLRSLIAGVRAGGAATVVLQTVARPAVGLFGGIDRRIAGTPSAILDRINRGILELAASPDVVLDAAGLSETVGLDAWHDQRQWHSFKLPFSQRVVPLYADQVARTLAALCGLTRKCLVLDLDNTLWGGVIGDDGLDGIRLGPGLAEGEAFLEIQRTVKRLRHRGIVLAVSSKNDDHVARQPFREHPDMLLEESDIAVFQANWSDKASNLEAIARELDLGLDALVLLDDNAAERELIRQRLPPVAVPELPDDPSAFPDALMASGWFDAIRYSGEDGRRADTYAARAIVAELREAAPDLAAFLESLEMVIGVVPFDALGRTRIAQLINKSNQFNVTTRRYSEAEVAALESDPAVRTFQVRLEDRLAEHGMIGVVICRVCGGDEWQIDTWLMSCRVLGRRVEEAVLAAVVARARHEGVARLIGRYIPSGRNKMVEHLYQCLGFVLADQTPEQTTWTLSVADFIPQPLPFKRDAAQ